MCILSLCIDSTNSEENCFGFDNIIVQGNYNNISNHHYPLYRQNNPPHTEKFQEPYLFAKWPKLKLNPQILFKLFLFIIYVFTF